MNTHNYNPLAQKQKPLRPKLDDIIIDALEGVSLKNAIDFSAFLKMLKSNPTWASANSWKVSYKGQVVCYIKLHGSNAFNLEKGSWQVGVHLNYEDAHPDIISDESLVQTLWDNVKYCYRCSNCRGGDKILFGKEFKDVCHGPVVFINPDSKALECVKRLIAIKRQEISDVRKT